MTDYGYLVHLIYCAVHGTQPQEKPEGVSFKNVFEIGKLHEVSNIAFLSVDKLKNKPEGELYDEWKVYYYFSVRRNARQKAVYETVINALHSEGIRTLEAQGTITKTLYPSPELRMMSDIDLIIDMDNLEKAMGIMQGLGYSTSQKQPVEFDAHKGQELIEFHTQFFTEYMFNRRERYAGALDEPFSHSVPKGSADALSFKLSDTYYYLYSIIHIIAHFEVAGCGIRRILDLYYLKKAFQDKTDSDFINKVIDENNLRDSYDKLFALEGEWFENIKSSLDLSETVSDIINGCNHGSAELFLRNNIRKDEKDGVHFVKLRHLLNIFFPKKDYICLEYPVCREKNYPLIICWIYRLFSKLKAFNFSHAIHRIKTIIKSK